MKLFSTLLLLVCFSGFAVAQNKIQSKLPVTAPQIPSNFNKVASVQPDHFKRLPTRGDSSQWLNYAQSYETEYAAGGPYYSPMLLFPDTNIIFGVMNGVTYTPPYHGAAVTIDPFHMLVPGNSIAPGKFYTLDSVGIKYAYVRHTNAVIVDTLVIKIIRPDTGFWYAPLINTGDTARWKRIPYDHAINDASDTSAYLTIRYRLTVNDTTPGSNVYNLNFKMLSLAVPGIPAQNSPIAMTISFRPNYNYSRANNDSVFGKNAFFLLSSEENGQGTAQILNTATDFNASYVVNNGNLYPDPNAPGFASQYYPSIGYADAYAYENHMAYFHVTGSYLTTGSGDTCTAGTVTSSSSTVCQGSTVELTTTGSSGFLQWQVADSNGVFADISGANNDYYIDVPAAGHELYRVIATNGTCMDSSTNVTVTINPGVSAQFSVTSSGDTAFFNATGSASNYLWDFGDGGFIGNGSSVNHVYPGTGVYYVCLTATGNSSCDFHSCEDVAVGGASIPCQSFFYIFPDSLVPHVWYLAYWATGVQPITYTWYWGDGDSTIAQYPSHTYDSAGYYNICLKTVDGNGCGTFFCDSSFHLFRTTNSMLSVTVINTTSTGTAAEPVLNHTMSINPNPCISCTVNGVENANDISITDLLGRNTNASFSKTSGGYTINLPDSASGIYFVRNMRTGQMVKFVVEK